MSIKDDCVEIIERIISSGKDENLPNRSGHEAVALKGSLDGYHLEARYGPKQYEDAEALYDALLVIYTRVREEDEPEESLLQDLNHIDPGEN